MMGFLRKIKNSYFEWLLAEEDVYFSIQSQEKIRKDWLIALYVFMVQGVLAVLLMHSSGLFEGINLNYSVLWGSILGSALFSFAISYIFAYKKHGTMWLMLSIISIPFGQLSDLVKFNDWTGSVLLMLALSFGMKAYYWIHCVRLYKINLYRKRQKRV